MGIGVRKCMAPIRPTTPGPNWVDQYTSKRLATSMGKGKRYDVRTSLPGLRPTTADTPGPGAYESIPPFTQPAQRNSKRPSSPAPQFARLGRDKVRQVYVPGLTEIENKCIESPGPAKYNVRASYNARNMHDSTAPATFTASFGRPRKHTMANKDPDRASYIPNKSAVPAPGSYLI